MTMLFFPKQSWKSTRKKSRLSIVINYDRSIRPYLNYWFVSVVIGRRLL